MIRKSVLTILLLHLLCLIGCSFVPFQYMPVDANIDTNNTSLPLLDPNDGPLKKIMAGKNIRAFDTKSVIDLKEPCKIKYKPLSGNSCKATVTGRLGKNYKCSVLIDTGTPLLSMLSYNVVKDNNLSFYPIKGQSPSGGFCYLPYLKLGDATIRDIPCVYMNRQWGLRFFGIPVNKTRTILFGLQLMREFRYILFDSVHRELTLSAKQSFMPLKDDQWLQYPFKIKDEINRNLRLLVDIPIEGNTYHLALDTGSYAGLQVDRKFFDKLSESIKLTVKKQKFKYPIYQEGWVDCQVVVLPELNFCHRDIKNAQIVILPDDMAYKYSNFVGMQYFKDTVLVLDFERELMWVKK